MMALLIIAIASISATAQPGSLGIFADVSGTNNDLNDTGVGLLLLYVVHVYTPGATAVQFAIPHPWCFTATYLSEAVTAPYIKIGTCSGPNATGCAIAYGSCMSSPNMILTMQYFKQGTTLNCCCLYILPDPSATPREILVTDCADPPNLLTISGGFNLINRDENCWCDCGGCTSDVCINGNPLPVEDTTWGAIKTLYRNR